MLNNFLKSLAYTKFWHSKCHILTSSYISFISFHLPCMLKLHGRINNKT